MAGIVRPYVLLDPEVVPEGLLPWQHAVLRLYNRLAVLSGAWQWRQYVLSDVLRISALGDFMNMQKSLVAAGEEYSVSVWRPQVNLTPADYRLALVCWGPFLDMSSEEIYQEMNSTYGAMRRG